MLSFSLSSSALLLSPPITFCLLLLFSESRWYACRRGERDVGPCCYRLHYGHFGAAPVSEISSLILLLPTLPLSTLFHSHGATMPLVPSSTPPPPRREVATTLPLHRDGRGGRRPRGRGASPRELGTDAKASYAGHYVVICGVSTDENDINCARMKMDSTDERDTRHDYVMVVKK